MWSMRLTSLALLPLLVGPAYGVDVTMCGQVVPAGETGVLQADPSGCDTGVILDDNAILQMNGHSISGVQIAIHCFGRRCSVSGPGEIFGAGEGVVQDVAGLVRLSVDNVNFHDNATTIINGGGRVFATNLTVTNNGFTGPFPLTVYAVYAIRLRGTNLNVTNNSGFGIGGWSVRLFDSVVTGNNGLGAGVDILSKTRPQLNNATCGHSSKFSDTSLSWGVCTGDP